MRAVACATSPPYPTRLGRYASAPHGTRLLLVREGSRLRPEPLPLHGGDQAPLRPEPPEGPGPDRRRAAPSVRLHALPEGRQDHQGLAPPGAPPWPTRASSASVPWSGARWRSSRRAARRSTTSTSFPSPTATPGTTWCSPCAPCWTSST